MANINGNIVIENDQYNYLEELTNELQGYLKRPELNTNPTIDSAMFGHVFLPFFADDENKEYPQVTLGHWLSIAGNPFQAVDIIYKNEVIATVPPMYDRDVLQINDPLGEVDERPRIGEVWKIVSLLRDRSTNQAESYFLQQIRGRLSVARTRERVIEHAEAWNKIYELYDREAPYPQVRAMIEGFVEEKTDKNKPTQSQDSDDGTGLGDGFEFELA